MLHSILLQNFLSFGDDSSSLELKRLNIIIGPNGSGKSNLIEAFSVIRHAPVEITEPIFRGGGAQEYIFKGGDADKSANIEVIFEKPPKPGWKRLKYLLSFRSDAHSNFQLSDEKIEEEEPRHENEAPYFHYHFNNGYPTINIQDKKNGRARKLQRDDIEFDLSILAQRSDPDQYPELNMVSNNLKRIVVYKDIDTSSNSPLRRPQSTTQRSDYLLPDASNLGLVLNKFANMPAQKRKIVDLLKEIYSDVTDYNVLIQGGTAQLFLIENDYPIPAVRLSDGTLRFICLVAMLLDPNPPPVICIEEPELGMHPDIIPTIADLLLEASEKTQLVVTTHSDILVNCMSDTPEFIIIADKIDGKSILKRLDSTKLAPWLQEYRLGELWNDGQLGGKRW